MQQAVNLRFKSSTFFIIGIIGISIILIFLNLIVTVSSFDTDIRGVESNVIYTIQRTMVAGRIYTNPESLPYSISQYSPLYYIIIAKLANILGLQPGVDIYLIYLLGRITSSIFAILISIIVYFICYIELKLTKLNSFTAYVTAMIVSVPWYFLVRPDALKNKVNIVCVYRNIFFVSLDFVF